MQELFFDALFSFFQDCKIFLANVILYSYMNPFKFVFVQILIQMIMMTQKRYTPGEVISRVGKGLNHHKLSYFVREGYIDPEKEKRGHQVYKIYTESDFWIIERAMTYIEKYQTRPQAAFERARREYNQAELDLGI